MKVLFDHGVPVQLRRLLAPHFCMTARSMGWDRLKNGDLLRAAELDGFEVLLKADQNIVYQQNNSERDIALVVLGTNSLERLTICAEQIAAAITRGCQGSYELVAIPRSSTKR